MGLSQSRSKERKDRKEGERKLTHQLSGCHQRGGYIGKRNGRTGGEEGVQGSFSGILCHYIGEYYLV